MDILFSYYDNRIWRDHLNPPEPGGRVVKPSSCRQIRFGAVGKIVETLVSDECYSLQTRDRERFVCAIHDVPNRGQVMVGSITVYSPIGEIVEALDFVIKNVDDFSVQVGKYRMGKHLAHADTTRIILRLQHASKAAHENRVPTIIASLSRDGYITVGGVPIRVGQTQGDLHTIACQAGIMDGTNIVQFMGHVLPLSGNVAVTAHDDETRVVYHPVGVLDALQWSLANKGDTPPVEAPTVIPDPAASFIGRTNLEGFWCLHNAGTRYAEHREQALLHFKRRVRAKKVEPETLDEEAVTYEANGKRLTIVDGDAFFTDAHIDVRGFVQAVRDLHKRHRHLPVVTVDYRNGWKDVVITDVYGKHRVSGRYAAEKYIRMMSGEYSARVSFQTPPEPTLVRMTANIVLAIDKGIVHLYDKPFSDVQELVDSGRLPHQV